MALYLDELPALVGTAQLKGRFPPRVWRGLRAVELEASGVRCTVELLVVAAPTCHGGRKRLIRCPCCGRAVAKVALVQGAWACRACRPWRSRNVRRAHERSADARPPGRDETVESGSQGERE